MFDASEYQIKQNILERMDRCSVCHREFAADDLNVIRRERGFWVIAVTCEDCHNRNLVAAVPNDGDTAEARSALRELSRSNGYEIAFDEETSAFPPNLPAKAPRAASGPVVSAGDVVDMHEFLADLVGYFRRLFREIPDNPAG